MPENLSDIERLAFSPGEAAASIGCSRPHLYKQINEGKLRTITVGRRRLITRQALLEFLGDAPEAGAA